MRKSLELIVIVTSKIEPHPNFQLVGAGDKNLAKSTPSVLDSKCESFIGTARRDSFMIAHTAWQRVFP
jgi:hypothetical protein